MSGCVIRCERPKKKCGAEKKNWGLKIFLGGRNNSFVAEHHNEAAPKKKKKKTRFFRLGTEKYDFSAPKKEQRSVNTM